MSNPTDSKTLALLNKRVPVPVVFVVTLLVLAIASIVYSIIQSPVYFAIMLVVFVITVAANSAYRRHHPKPVKNTAEKAESISGRRTYPLWVVVGMSVWALLALSNMFGLI